MEILFLSLWILFFIVTNKCFGRNILLFSNILEITNDEKKSDRSGYTEEAQAFHPNKNLILKLPMLVCVNQTKGEKQQNIHCAI